MIVSTSLAWWSNSSPSYTAGRYTIAKDTNTLLRAYVAANSNVYLMDTMTTRTVDGSDVPLANVLLDGLHPSAKGAYLYAKQFLADNTVTVPASISALLPETASQDILVTPSIHQCWANPMSSGTTGWLQGEPYRQGLPQTLR